MSAKVLKEGCVDKNSDTNIFEVHFTIFNEEHGEAIAIGEHADWTNILKIIGIIKKKCSNFWYCLLDWVDINRMGAFERGNADQE